jgi:hypothetical protein
MLLLVLLCGAPATSAEVVFDRDDPRAAFAANALQKALRSQDANIRVILETRPSEDLEPEGFSIRREDGLIRIIGEDSAGLMYGGLDVAESIHTTGIEAVDSRVQNPYMQMRGVKFNIPLDVRTPSYTDLCDAAQKNIPEVWSMDFWTEFIDTLAEYRYNYVSIWSLHPFPSLVQVPEYPEIALEDVKRSRGPFQEYYPLQGVGFDAPEIMEDLETVKRMTIDDKIDFWRKVMAYGKSRNVDFYVVTWNIFTYGTEGRYGIDDDPDNPVTRDYFRKSVEQLLLTYPDLAGVGITTGENMHGLNQQEKEEWVFDTYGRGVIDASKQSPGRKIRFIHRQHQTGADQVLGVFEPLIEHPDIDFIFSFKYAKAHVYSETEQPYHEGFVPQITGKVKTIWTLRNDDIYYFRWGAPDFVREFIRNIPYDVSQGYYYGSDQWIWGREFLQKNAENPRPLEIRKHWLQWMLWGRLGFDPELSNEQIGRIVQSRFPEIDGQQLLTAWQKASMTYPLVTGFHWGSLDFQWYIEGCRSRPHVAKTESGFHDVNHFIRLKPHRYCETVSIPDYVKSVLEDRPPTGQTPLQLADQIESNVNEAEAMISEFGKVQDQELNNTLDDIRIVCEMGRYYAAKIRGASYVALCRETKKPAHRQAAIKALSQAVKHWKRFTERALANHHNPLWTNRVGHVDWRKQFQDVEADLAIARGLPVDTERSRRP